MWFYTLIAITLVTPLARTKDSLNEVFPCRSRVNSVEEFRCQNGTGCISVRHICDGVRHCIDGSDEDYCLNIRSTLQTEDFSLQRSKRQSSGGSGGCILPPYPTHGTYEVSKYPNTRPGEALDSFALTVSCRRGFGVVNHNGDEITQQLYCVNGEYQYQSMPRCVRFCKLNPDPSVQYTCHVPGIGFKTCKSYVAPGTLVNPICNSPIYYSSESLPYMKCNFGYWDYVAQCRAECGRVTPEGTELVIDGKQAKRGELPWHVAIYRTTTTPYNQICGGTLITNKLVLSAAHCFWSELRKKLPASDFAVAIGKLYRAWDSENDVGAQKSDIKEIRIPSRFQGAAANFQEDIAALILKTPFVYMTYVRPVCVYYDVNFERIQLKDGNSGKVAGWGLTSANGVSADTLQVLEMPFVNVHTCIETLPASFSEYITGDKFCAGYTTGKALCKGDSGGGLSFPDRGLGVDRYYLRGIVSAAPTDDQKLCNNYVYSTFTMITRHQDFIREALAASAEKRCPQYSFQCDDGSCVDQGADCNGRKDCADGSDETEELCIPGIKPTIAPPAVRPEPNPLGITETIPTKANPRPNPLPTSTPNSCILPEYPVFGTYDTNALNSTEPGQSFDYITLTIKCQDGYRLLAQGGSRNTTVEQIVLNCFNGKWQHDMPKCIRMCKLALDPSIELHNCLAPDHKLTVCEKYLTSGTSVSVRCKTPDYYSTRDLPNMRCISGFWDYVPRCKPECGQVSNKTKASVELGEIPWHVGIHQKYPRPYKQICGGSLVSHTVVISAAYCFWNGRELQASDYSVTAGKLYRAWGDVRDEAAQKSDVKTIHTTRTTLTPRQDFPEDIAAFILATPFEYNSFVRPVCLDFDFNFERTQLQEGNLGLIAGWGKTTVNGNFSPVLRKIEYQYISLPQCRAKISITEDKLCAESPNGPAACEGDGGGGLTFKSSTGQNIERYYLRGVVSTPTLCNGSINAFTSIMKYEHFIKRFI